jgi:exopolysaccharide biosynthesis polyprenyl glycosylphosphotransferase
MNNDYTTEFHPSHEPRWLLPVVDVLLALSAWLLAYWVRYDLQILRPVTEINVAEFEPYIPYMVIFVAWLLAIYWGTGLYRPIRGRPWLDEVYVIINGMMSTTVLIMALSFIIQPIVFSRLMLVYVAGIAVILLSLTRVIQRVIRARLRARGIGIDRVLIIGVGELGQSVLRIMLARRELGYFPIGFMDNDSELGGADLGRLRSFGTTDNLEKVIREENVQTVIITLRWKNYDEIMNLVQQCDKLGVQVRVVPDVFQLNMKQVQVENLDGIPLLGVSDSVYLQQRERIVKRIIDVTLVVLASPLILLITGLVALAIRLEGNGPILYKQVRVGENGKLFDMVKFRSMIPDADKYRQELIQQHELDPRHPKIEDDPRITRVGNFIRRTSIDELPNLWNVLLGHMSLVGPRPPTPDEVTLYEPWHMKRLNIMPGVTGLWQISGRSQVPFDEMCLLDIYYIENWSLKLDIQILLLTVPRVLLRQGAY